MTVPGENRLENVARRYPLAAQAEWRKLLEHFDLATGFAFVVLLVPDSDGAELCRHELQTRLERGGRRLHTIELSGPDELRTLPGRFLELAFPPEAACVWLGSVVPDYVKDYADWRSAWEFALARLNAYRNPIREHCQFTLIFAGAPWLQEVLREIAPDLWSVRTLVVRIQPAAVSAGQPIASEMVAVQASDSSALDPHFALQQAEKLRGVSGKELALAGLLHRAGKGYAAHHDWSAAKLVLAEALELKQQHGAAPISLITTLNLLATACQVTGQIRRAIQLMDQALGLARQVGDLHAVGTILGNLGIAHFHLGDPKTAVRFHEQALSIDRARGDRHGETQDLGNLGLAYRALGDVPGALELYEQALAIDRELGERGGEASDLGNMGDLFLALGDARKAIELLNQQLSIAREIGDRLGEGSALGSLGNAHLVLGEAQKAQELYAQQLSITRAIGHRRGEGLALFNSALASGMSGRYAEAIQGAEAALRILEPIEDPNVTQIRAMLAEWRKTA